MLTKALYTDQHVSGKRSTQQRWATDLIYECLLGNNGWYGQRRPWGSCYGRYMEAAGPGGCSPPWSDRSHAAVCSVLLQADAQPASQSHLSCETHSCNRYQLTAHWVLSPLQLLIACLAASGTRRALVWLLAVRFPGRRGFLLIGVVTR